MAAGKFIKWIENSGGVLAVSRKLEVRPSAVYHWINRRNRPSLKLAQEIVTLSKGRVTLADILADTEK